MAGKYVVRSKEEKLSIVKIIDYKSEVKITSLLLCIKIAPPVLTPMRSMGQTC